ncbi:alpha/beta fold hydrolase [Embleya sp. NPDC055664]
MPNVRVHPGTPDEVELAYEAAGSGHPVILVHGWPFTSRFWDGQMRTLTDAGYRAIRYDRRGTGKSAHPWSGYDAETLAGDLLAFLDHLDVGPVAAVAFGSAAAETARAAVRAPERFARLVLAGTVVASADSARIRDLATAARRHRIAMLDDLIGRCFSVDGERVLDEPTLRHLVHDAAAASAQSTLDALASWSAADFLADLERVALPVLVVHGAADAFMPYAVSGARAVAAARAATSVVIDHAPHAMPLTHQHEFDTAVLDFLSGPTASGAASGTA